MTMPTAVRCEDFTERVEELALGMVDEPDRGDLLTHSAGCPRCQSLLDGFGTLVDRLLLAAPELEPPAGFESRVLARLGIDAPSQRRPHTLLWAGAAAVVVLLVVAVGVLRARVDAPTKVADASASIVTATGAELGSVRLVAQPAPHVLVMIAAPRPSPGTRHCELRRPDGTWVQVGTWQPADVAGGVWATGIDTQLLRATAMRITLDNGTVLASATFG